MKENESEQTVKVVDRRRFTEDGGTKSSAGDLSEDSTRTESSSIKADVKHSTQSSQQPTAQEGAYSKEMEFSSFVVGLATQALVMIGEIPDPESNRIIKNKESARQTVDILVLLKEKTKGNLTSSEEALLTEVVSTMQMKFVKSFAG